MISRIRNMISRAVLGRVDDSKKAQAAQIELLEGETQDDAERFQGYGFTSVPFEGAEALVVFVGGTRSHPIIIQVEDRRFRLKGLEPGEVALYDDQEQTILLKRDGIRVESPFKVEIEAPECTVTADQATVESDNINLGAAGGPSVARVGDTVAGGVITSGSAKVKAA